MIITIGGKIGAGKTTLSTRLATALGYEELYVGGIFRAMAVEKGMSLEQFYSALENDPATEHEVDERQAKLMREKDNIIVQGRISWYFAQSSPFRVFNIFLNVDPAIGAQRSGSRKESVGILPDDMMTATAAREKQERARYKMLYGIEDYYDPSHYDLILDTSNLTEDEAFEKLMIEVHLRLEKPSMVAA